MQLTKAAFYPSRVGLQTVNSSKILASTPVFQTTCLSQDVFQHSPSPRFSAKNKLHEIAEDTNSWDRNQLQNIIAENPPGFLEERDNDGLTPLLRAALSGNLPVVRYLTKHTKAKRSEVVPDKGDTIMHLATRAASEPGRVGVEGQLTLDYLIRNKKKLGLNINALNCSNQTPKDVAPYGQLRDYIQSKGGRNWTTLAFMPKMADMANAMSDDSSGDEAECIVKYKSYG